MGTKRYELTESEWNRIKDMLPPEHPKQGKRGRPAKCDNRRAMNGITGLSARHIANIEKGDVNPSFEVLSTLVKTLGVSFDSIFDPSNEQVEAEIQEIAGLYRACPEQGRRLILASVRAMARELMDVGIE